MSLACSTHTLDVVESEVMLTIEDEEFLVGTDGLDDSEEHMFSGLVKLYVWVAVVIDETSWSDENLSTFARFASNDAEVFGSRAVVLVSQIRSVIVGGHVTKLPIFFVGKVLEAAFAKHDFALAK